MPEFIIFKHKRTLNTNTPFPKGSRWRLEWDYGGYILHRLPKGKKRWMDRKTLAQLINTDTVINAKDEDIANNAK